jgi:hypothetical protein
MVRDYDPATHVNNNLDRVLRHRDAIISHLNWVCIFLGFHSFGLYIHNDTMRALGRPQDMFSDSAIQPAADLRPVGTGYPCGGSGRHRSERLSRGEPRL